MRLDRLVRQTFQWLSHGFFMQHGVELDFAGTLQIKRRELIGYDPESGAFSSYDIGETRLA